MNETFRNQTVWITGASAGIGESAARAFAKLGAKVVLIARREERLLQITQEIKNAYALKLDVTNHNAVEEELRNLPEAFAIPDILVNNAGLARGLKFAIDATQDEIDLVIDTNIKGVLHFTKIALPIMKQRNSGHIFTIGSVAAIKPYAKGAIYCGTKAFLEAYNLSLREELVETRIRLTLLSPGMVGGTEFSNVRLGNVEAAANVYKDITPLSPEDISDQIIFAASRPLHVNIAHIECYPVHQASTTTIFRGDKL